MRSEVQLLLGPPPPILRCSAMDGRKSRRVQDGALAQLGEHLLCKQGVIGSIPIGSTIFDECCSAGPAVFRGGPHRYSRDEDTNLPLRWQCAGSACIFDIVNGFLIDAATRGV